MGRARRRFLREWRIPTGILPSVRNSYLSAFLPFLPYRNILSKRRLILIRGFPIFGSLLHRPVAVATFIAVSGTAVPAAGLAGFSRMEPSGGASQVNQVKPSSDKSSWTSFGGQVQRHHHTSEYCCTVATSYTRKWWVGESKKE